MRKFARRDVLKTISALASASFIPTSVSAKTSKPIRIGYLHIPSCASQMWLMKELGAYEKAGLTPEFFRFNTGVDGFSALVGGSIDVITTGGVSHNFPARGQGIVVLPNMFAWAGQIFGRSDAGINTLKDLRGKKISTTLGTSAHLFLHEALKSVGLNSATDVSIVNQTMPAAVTSFLGGHTPALATWVPFNLRVKHAETSKLLSDSKTFAPKAGFVVTAFSASEHVVKDQSDLISRLSDAWIPANNLMLEKRSQAIDILHSKYFSDSASREDIEADFDTMQLYNNKQWSEQLRSGTLEARLNAVTNIFKDMGAIKQPLPASQYSNFDAFRKAMSA